MREFRNILKVLTRATGHGLRVLTCGHRAVISRWFADACEIYFHLTAQISQIFPRESFDFTNCTGLCEVGYWQEVVYGKKTSRIIVYFLEGHRKMKNYVLYTWQGPIRCRWAPQSRQQQLANWPKSYPSDLHPTAGSISDISKRADVQIPLLIS